MKFLLSSGEPSWDGNKSSVVFNYTVAGLVDNSSILRYNVGATNTSIFLVANNGTVALNGYLLAVNCCITSPAKASPISVLRSRYWRVKSCRNTGLAVVVS